VSVRSVGVAFGAVHGALRMLRGTVKRIEPERRVGGCVNDVVLDGGGNDHRAPVAQFVFLAVEYDDSIPLLHPDELVVVAMHFLADLFARLKCHEHELDIRSREQDAPEIFIGDGVALDVRHVPVHIHLGGEDSFSLQQAPM